MKDLRQARELATRLEVVTESGSTNAELRSHGADTDGWPHLSVLLTDNQTAGRGRLDRTWLAPAGSALAISVLLRVLPTNLTAHGWIPLLAGVAMADAIASQLPARHVAVKWPNDVLVEDRKICGILAEAGGDAVVVGAGVNTAMTAEQLPVPTATSFALAGVRVDEDRLVADYLRALDSQLTALIDTGDAIASGLHSTATARCSTIGRHVRVSLPGDQTLDGVATGLDADGRLLVDAAGTEHAISAGDVVHVRST
ncbi:biotin--[acetyl-CoA-carboxylase] ligase [Microbacterium sp. SSW1-49]|uniref:biotin--[biotin carboxyl-carrier protein] ligase n=1 Tax=Microbacterium croceum TaxID=2851645 RepID=A0ABT0FF28_9MICO|nr:biotin--[acetyl-CoA-carboxylase] ligase [Microbacterium croceum]MCK2036302.1 biotin--[acetyl-CoA-carboxylase] ligase [Microbacterium croceum]